AGPNKTLGSELESEGSIAAVSALSTYLQTPCSIDHDVKSGVKASRIPTIKPQKTKVKAYEAGKIKPIEPFAQRTSRAHHAAPYTEWRMQSNYSTSQHTIPMPVARFSDGSLTSQLTPSVAHIALAPPSTTRTIRIKGRRIGAPPQFPVAQSFRDAKTG